MTVQNPMFQPDNLSAIINQVIEMAWQARQNSYAPYSGFQVGSALYLPALNVFVAGANVENVSYGATICAERSAIVSAVGRYGVIVIGAIGIVSHSKEPIMPCGICLQVIQELGNAQTIICSENRQGLRRQYQLSDLMPQGFKTY